MSAFTHAAITFASKLARRVCRPALILILILSLILILFPITAFMIISAATCHHLVICTACMCSASSPATSPSTTPSCTASNTT